MKMRFILYFLTVFLISCTHVHKDKFGKELNEERKKIGLPIIKDEWKLDDNVKLPNLKNCSLRFTDSRQEDKTLPYHAYKTIYYNGDTLVAEIDTYLNMDHKWFKDGKLNTGFTDTLQNSLKLFHALNAIYVYKPLYNAEKDFSRYSEGFKFELVGEEFKKYYLEFPSKEEAEDILTRWNLKRLNY